MVPVCNIHCNKSRHSYVHPKRQVEVKAYSSNNLTEYNDYYFVLHYHLSIMGFIIIIVPCFHPRRHIQILYPEQLPKAPIAFVYCGLYPRALPFLFQQLVRRLRRCMRHCVETFLLLIVVEA